MRKLKKIDIKLKKFVENIKITSSYSGIYRDSDDIKKQILSALVMIKIQCLQENVPGIGLKLAEANKLFHQVERKGGRYGIAITEWFVINNIFAMHKNHKTLSNVVHEEPQMSQYYSMKNIYPRVDEVKKQVMINIERENKRIEEIRRRYVSENIEMSYSN